MPLLRSPTKLREKTLPYLMPRNASALAMLLAALLLSGCQTCPQVLVKPTVPKQLMQPSQNLWLLTDRSSTPAPSTPDASSSGNSGR